MIAALALVAALASPSPAPQAHHTAADIVSVELDSSWGGLGAGRYVRTTYRRHDGYLSNDAGSLSSEHLQTLLNVIESVDASTPSPTEFGFGTTLYDRPVDGLARCLNVADTLPDVVTWWSAVFVSSESRRAFIATLYTNDWKASDDYPHERIILRMSDGTNYSAQSDTNNIYMLPFHVVRGDIVFDTYAPALPRAIADVFTIGVNRDRFSGDEIENDYGMFVCKQNAEGVRQRTIAAVAPKLAAFIRRNGVMLKGVSLASSLAELDGYASFIGWPRNARFEVRIRAAPYNAPLFQKAGISELRASSALGERVLQTPWVKHWFASVPTWYFVMSTLDNNAHNPYSSEVSTRRTVCKIPTLCAQLDRDPGAVFVYANQIGGGTPQATEWVFLSDGRAILTGFSSELLTVGPAPAGDIASGRGWWMDRATVTVFDREGQILSSVPVTRTGI